MNLTSDKVVWDLYHETKVELVQTVDKLHKLEVQLLEFRKKFDETRTKLDDTQSKLEEVRLVADQTQMKLEEIQQNFDETWVKIDETKALLNVTKKRLAWKEHALHKLENVNNNWSEIKSPRCPICIKEICEDTRIAKCIKGHQCRLRKRL